LPKAINAIAVQKDNRGAFAFIMVGDRGAVEGYEGLQSCLWRMQVAEG